MASRMRKKERSGPYPYDRSHPLAMQYANKFSNQCKQTYFESGHSKYVDRKIYIIERRKESSSERDQILLKMLKKDKNANFLKSNLVKTWLKEGTLKNSKRSSLFICFMGSLYINY